MSHNPRILARNVRGTMFSSLCLPNMPEYIKCNIAIVSEHNLKYINVSYLDSVHPDHLSCRTYWYQHIYTVLTLFGLRGHCYYVQKGARTVYMFVNRFRFYSHYRNRTQTVMWPICVHFWGFSPSDSIIQPFLSELNLLENLVCSYWGWF